MTKASTNLSHHPKELGKSNFETNDVVLAQFIQLANISLIEGNLSS